MSQKHGQNLIALIVRWIARIGSVVSAGLLMAFMFGGSERPPNLQESVGLLFFPGGVLLGMAVAWKYELIGSLVAVASLVAFYVMQLLVAGRLPSGPYYFLFSLPGFLFLIAWCYEKCNPVSRFPSRRVSST